MSKYQEAYKDILHYLTMIYEDYGIDYRNEFEILEEAVDKSAKYDELQKLKGVYCKKYPLKNYRYYKLNSQDVEEGTFSLIDQQEIVDFKRNHTELDIYKYGNIKIEPNVITYNGKVYVAIDSSNPTFEQVIKEWEAAGYFYIEDDDCIYFDDDSRFIRIYKKTKEYCICDMFGTGICFNMKEHDLIHKIIKTM